MNEDDDVVLYSQDTLEFSIVKPKDIEEFLGKLSVQDRLFLLQKLLGNSDHGLTVVLNQNVMMDNSLALQLNGDSAAISEKLKDVPPEVIAKLVDAIADRISKETRSEP